jgi:PAS domain S-box-containing protein
MIKEALLEGTSEAERFRLLVEAVSDYAIYMLDPNGIVSSWNAGAERIKGYKASEILGQSFANFYEPADRTAGIPQRVLEIAARDGKFQAEGWRVRKDGSRFWAFVIIDAIYDNGELIGFAKITRDLTERREAEEGRMKSSVSTSRYSTLTRTAAAASRRAALPSPSAKAASRPRPGGSARTARASGPTS